MLEAAEHGFGVTLAMTPLIKARPGFGKKLVVPFDVPVRSTWCPVPNRPGPVYRCAEAMDRGGGRAGQLACP